ncbi:MAG: hypothetical protein FJX77_01515, partial [Armatimonadetes bacterium]|nr:hypothetical protein [Armatimonadota bacterium]
MNWITAAIGAAAAAMVASVGAATTAGGEETGGISVRATRPAFPVLIHNEHGPILRVEVAATGATGTLLKAILADLGDTDSLRDLAGLQWFLGDETGNFSP